MNDKIIIGECNRGISNLVRPHFSEGLLLQDDDLTTGVSYTRQLSRLMFRTMFGCGVLCGLRVKEPALACGKLTIQVEKGVALTCLGDPVELTGTKTIEIDQCKFTGDEIWIGIRHYEKCCAPRTTVCPPDDSEALSVCTRERDGYELCAFSERPPCACGCDPVAAPETKAANDKGNAASAAKPAKAAKAAAETQQATGAADCRCNTRTEEAGCYGKHYAGDCPCDCCDCEWILLAQAKLVGEEWKVDHSVRRFVRPVLMQDPLLNNK